MEEIAVGGVVVSAGEGDVGEMVAAACRLAMGIVTETLT